MADGKSSRPGVSRRSFLHLAGAARRDGVVALARNDVANASARVGDVVLVAGDQVDVEVEDRLAGGGSDVDADIEAVRGMAAGDQLTASVDAGHQGGSLLGRGVEPRRHVPTRDDEQVA